MPDHCFATNGNQILENFIDFEVNFNVAVDLDKPLFVNQSIAQAASNLCSTSWVNDNTGAQISKSALFINSGNLDDVVGVAVNGALIYSGLQPNQLDAIYPSFTGKGRADSMVNVDECFGTYLNTKNYHYHSYSPCIWNTQFKQYGL